MATIEGKKEMTDHIEKSRNAEETAMDYTGAHAKINPVEIRLVRKLDMIMLPTLWFMYWFNYLDRNAITVARLDTMEGDLKISSTQYQTCVSILFVGYVLGQVPANMIIVRVRPSLFLASFMALWSIVSTVTGITHNYTGLLLTRFFLGILEAPFWPGSLYLLASFYTKKEIATRISILFSANIAGTAFAGLIAIGVFHMEGVAGLAGWRWLFIIQGIVSFVIAVAGAFILPDEPLKTSWLTPEERELAHARVSKDTVEQHANTSSWKGLKEAASDYKLWILILMNHLHMAASNYKNFFPTIVGTLGFDRTATLALTCPPYVIAGLVAIAYSWNSGRMNERTWHITIANIFAVVGFIVACATLNVGARYFAMCLFASGVYATTGIAPGWVAATCGQTKEKKAVALALNNAISTIAPIYTAYLWPTSNAPRYSIAMGFSAGVSLAWTFGAWYLRRVLIKENRKLRASDDETTAFYAY